MSLFLFDHTLVLCKKDVFSRLARISEHTAAAHGATVEHAIPADAGHPVTRNDPALTARMRPSLERIVGADNVVDPGLSMGAEDFSYYALEVPSMFFFVGATPRGTDPITAPSNHSPEFFLDEDALKIGSRALLAVAMDYLAGGKPE